MSSEQAAQSAILILDPNGPIEMFPLRKGGPVRYREATALEVFLWDCETRLTLAGGLWTPAIAAEMTELYSVLEEGQQPRREAEEGPRKAA